ncbi:Shikimate dehydrogenase [Limihaloglobus sulfuriphilus]|uniref:Shikimate dehydrogenase (NADP(+)) n=1 Tax=Limihaloglobus sulfuriphilus TaxID=1851148 RepID=A0A1Q2MI74_9BACT|nr:shikimate dehydrogenase [Limihaloglobus sulfuriphilus]AQQ72391.1 Shikimate dehydrogenase [Limihaloglobus sulfuriphilus]
MAYLTVPVTANNCSDAAASIDKSIKNGADIIEIRADYIKDISAGELKKLILIIKDSSAASLVTCRKADEGGKNNIPDNNRLEMLLGAVNAGADYIDCEFASYSELGFADPLEKVLQNTGTRLIISAHSFAAPFNNLQKLHDQIIEAAPNCIPKLVYTANHINDTFAMADLLHSSNKDIIGLCMGSAGQWVRLAAGKLGSFLTFASLEKGLESADGQIELYTARNLYRINSQNSETALFGIIADPVAHSKSPLIHNELFITKHCNSVYLPLHVHAGEDKLETFLDSIAQRPYLGFRGFSVTLPHKMTAYNYLSSRGYDIDKLADKVGAVNTLLLNRGRYSGYNTDCRGALQAIESSSRIQSRDELKKCKTLILGAGGVARAVAAALTELGTEVTICNRTEEKAAQLAGIFKCKYIPADKLSKETLKRITLIVNCTSLGMDPNINGTPLAKELIPKNATVFDTVYNPKHTKLLQDAVNAGAEPVTGDTMFIEQAILQQQLFSGFAADQIRGEMYRIFS